MENKAVKYEKPELKFVSMRSEENVADPCWSPSDTDKVTLYYDTPGTGYVKFSVVDNGKNCGSAIIKIEQYYNIPEDKKPTEEDLIAKVVEACGGNSGNPYKKSNSVAPDPNPSWS